MKATASNSVSFGASEIIWTPLYGPGFNTISIRDSLRGSMTDQPTTMAMQVARAIQMDPRAPRMPGDVGAGQVESIAIEWLRERLRQEKAEPIKVQAPLSPDTMIDVLAKFEDNSSLAIEVQLVRRPSEIPNIVDRAMRFWDRILTPNTLLLFVVFLPEHRHGALRNRMAPLSRNEGFILLPLPLQEPSNSKEQPRGASAAEIKATFERYYRKPDEREAADRMRGTSSVEIEATSKETYQRRKAAGETEPPPASEPQNDPLPDPPPPPPAPEPQSTRPEVLSDDAIASLAEDSLGFGRYARALYALIDSKRTKTPLTLAIHAPWGSGKTSLARLIEEQAQFPAYGGSNPHKVFWFNAWLHDEGNAVHASFVSALARFCNDQRPFYERWFFPLSANLLSVHERRDRRNFLTVGFFVLSVLFLLLFARDLLATLPNIFLGELKDEARASAFAKGGALVALAAAIPFAYSTLTKAFTEIGAAMGSFVLDPKLEAQTASLKMVRKELSNLVRWAVPPGSRLIVIVDDLERCRPPGCIDLLEGMNQLFEQQDLPVVFIVLADMTALSAAATVKYETLSKHYTPTAAGAGQSPGSHHFGRIYLEKLITLQFDIPRIPQERLVIWTNALQALPAAKGVIDNKSLSTLEWTLRCAQDDKISTSEFYRRAKRRGAQASPDKFDSKIAEIMSNTLIYNRVSLAYIFLLCRLSVKREAGGPDAAKVSAFIRNALKGLIGASILCFAAAPFTGWILLWATAPIVIALAYFSLWSIDLIYYNSKTGASRAGSPIEPLIGKDDQRAIDGHSAERSQSAESHSMRRKAEEESEDIGDRFDLARKTALTFVRSRPRSLKRMINRLRLAIYLTQDQSIDPITLGKWTALQENWPGLAHAIAGDEKPSNPVSDLESGDEKKCEAALKILAPWLTLSDGLKEFLASEPKLAPKIGALIRLSAA